VKQSQVNLLQGTLDLLILKAVGEGELHGLGISRRVEQISRCLASSQRSARAFRLSPITARNKGLLVREVESGFRFQRLTRSIHSPIGQR
jgi:hypothetical protein